MRAHPPAGSGRTLDNGAYVNSPVSDREPAPRSGPAGRVGRRIEAMVPADNPAERQGSTSPKQGDASKGDAHDPPDREFLPDPRRAASAITQAKKRLARPSMPGREPED